MISPDEAVAPLVVVFGYGPGLGESIARRFASAGYRIAGASRHEPRAPAAGESAVPLHWFSCDVSEAASIEACMQAIDIRLGAPSVVVYNPMRLQITPFLQLEEAEFEAAWRVSGLGAMRVAKSAIPRMLPAGGTLILTGATASVRGSAGFAALASAKFALRGLGQCLAREFGPQGLHVAHVIIDGLVWSPQTTSRFDPAKEACLLPEDIAEVYLQLARQAPSCWTQELDLRPSSGKF